MIVFVLDCGHSVVLFEWTPMILGPNGECLRWCSHCRQHKHVKLTVNEPDLETLVMALLPATKDNVVKHLCYPKNVRVQHLGFNEKIVRSVIWKLRFEQHKVYQSRGVLKVV